MSAPTLGSLFAGIGGFDVAFERAGFAPAWQVEIDPTCRRVLARHWPDVARRRDVRECGAHNLAPVDVVTFGSPCQDLSVAGRRAGLGGARSGLFYEAVRIIGGLRPTVAVWENVPGALSSNGGRDFGAALNALAHVGAVAIGWAVLDAQWFGVPQRRRRVFAVASFGDGPDPGEILALAEGLSGHPPPGRAAGEDPAATIGGGAPGRGWSDDTDRMTFVPFIAPFDMQQVTSRADRQRVEAARPAPTLHQGGGAHAIVHTLRAEGADASEDGTGRGVPLVFDWQSGGDVRHNVSAEHTSALHVGQTPAVATGPMVRRLTPRECERLMGLPDDWTAHDAAGEPISDSARYRMLGNSVAVPVVEWLGRQLRRALERQPALPGLAAPGGGG